MVLRTGKKTYGTKDIEEVCQQAFEPYFQDEYTIDNLIKKSEEDEK